MDSLHSPLPRHDSPPDVADVGSFSPLLHGQMHCVTGREICALCRKIRLDARQTPRCDTANDYEHPLVDPQLPHT
jgi:hypothetical protein